MAAGTYYTGRLGGVVGASLAGAILGAQVTAAGVSAGFACSPRGRRGRGRVARAARTATSGTGTVRVMSTGPRPGSNPLAGLFDSLRGTAPASS